MKRQLKAPGKVIAQFDQWRTPIRGNANPETQTNDVWTWLVETRAWPLHAHRAAGSGEQKFPGWCFDRFGQSETRLPDGTKVFIGGEHEDHYDPDFYIYNDVIVIRPKGTTEIYGYSEDAFKPTDFHSAPLCGDDIYIIGGQRYCDDRNHNSTWVYRLELQDFSIHRLETCGEAPPWLHRHKVHLSSCGQKIICSEGVVTHHPSMRAVENLSTWEFDLRTQMWSKVETKGFRRWLLVREDEGYNDLWAIGQVVGAMRNSRDDRFAAQYQAEFAKRGHVVDATLFNSRFSPPIPHSPVDPIPEQDSHRVHRLLVEGVMVRIVEGMDEIAVTVEGDLGSELLQSLQQFGREIYSALEGGPYKIIQLQ